MRSRVNGGGGWDKWNEWKKVRSYIVLYPVRKTAQSVLHFTPLVDLFIPKPSRPFEAFSHSAISARRLFVHISTSVCIQVLVYTAESAVATRGERNCQNFETTARGF